MARRDVNGKSARCGRLRAAAAPAPCSLRARRPRPHRAVAAHVRRSQARRRRPRPLLHRYFFPFRRARPGLRRAHSSSARSRRAHPVRGTRAPGAPGRRERGARALRTRAPFPMEHDRCAPGNAPVRRSSRASRRRLHRLHRPCRLRRPHCPHRPHLRRRDRNVPVGCARVRRCPLGHYFELELSRCAPPAPAEPPARAHSPARTRRARAVFGLYARRA